MDDRSALLLWWLEGEGERQRRPILPPPQAKDLAVRGWVQVALCAAGGTLAAALFVCWLATGWDQSRRVTGMEELRSGYFLRAAGDPNRPAATPARPGGVLGMVLFAKVFAIALGTVIGAWILRAACALYNKLAGGKGSPSSVPELLFGKAMGITFVTILVDAVAGSVIGLLVGASGAAAGSGERSPAVIARLLSLPVSLLVMAAMNYALLPTTFVRGILIALCYLLVVFFVVVVLGVILGGLFLVVSLQR
jgi:hypothetical protein